MPGGSRQKTQISFSLIEFELVLPIICPSTTNVYWVRTY
jgi:hypothetical protein